MKDVADIALLVKVVPHAIDPTLTAARVFKEVLTWQATT